MESDEEMVARKLLGERIAKSREAAQPKRAQSRAGRRQEVAATDGGRRLANDREGRREQQQQVLAGLTASE